MQRRRIPPRKGERHRFYSAHVIVAAIAIFSSRDERPGFSRTPAPPPPRLIKGPRMAHNRPTISDDPRKNGDFEGAIGGGGRGCPRTVESRLFLIRSTSPACSPRSRKRIYIYIGAPFSLFLSYPRLEELVRGEGDGFEYAHAKCLGVRPRPRSLPAPRLWPSIRLSSLARDPAAINKGRRDAAGQSRCRAECIGFCQTGEW